MRFTTVGRLRREALRLAFESVRRRAGERREWLRWCKGDGAKALRALQSALKCDVPLAAVGVPDLSALGLAASVLPYTPAALPVQVRLLQTGMKMHRQFEFPRDFYALRYLVTDVTVKAATNEIRKAEHLSHRLLDSCAFKLEPALPALRAPQVVEVVRWYSEVHTKREAAQGRAEPVGERMLQFFNQAVDRLSPPAAFSALNLSEVAAAVASFAVLRLTPDNLLSSLAVHTTQHLLPQAAAENNRITDALLTTPDDDEAEDDEAGEAPHTTAREQDIGHQLRREARVLSRAVAGFSKAAELGRVPLRDVLVELAAAALGDGGGRSALAHASTRQLVRFSFLSVAVSRKWGTDEPLRDAAVHEVLAVIGRLSLTERHSPRLCRHPPSLWRLLVNLAEAGQTAVVHSWVDHHLLADPSASPRLLATLAFTLVRLHANLGYRDVNGPAKREQKEGEEEGGAEEGEEEGDSGATEVLHGLLRRIRERALAPHSACLTHREASHVVFAYARCQLLDEDLLMLMSSVFCAAVDDPDCLVTPWQVTNFLHSIAFAHTTERYEPGVFNEAFDTVGRAIVHEKVDFAPEKPNHTVYILWAISKVGHRPEDLVDKLCALLNDEAINRLRLPTLIMAVNALSRLPARPVVTDTAKLLLHHAAVKITAHGSAFQPSVIDLLALSVSKGKWEMEAMIQPVFDVAKAITGSTGYSPAIFDAFSGKAAARVLWSFSVISVKHSVLCADLAGRFASREFVAEKITEPLALTSALVAMCRLHLKNIKAVGNLCAHAASMADQFTAISLADAVQAVAELAIPSKGLQLALARRACGQAAVFTPAQAASFVWNLSRSGITPGAIASAEDSAMLSRCYTVLVRRATNTEEAIASLDPRYVCRLLQTLAAIQYAGDTERVRRLLAAVLPHLRDIWWRDLANVLWACAVLRVLPSPAQVRLLQYYRKRQNFLPEDQKRVLLWDQFLSDSGIAAQGA
ncbi:hypothetical protein DIPPA_35852 [Diplonema papillatum]|nr:hypothetical protein DIPPA_35852 [Diplonema papillatum]